MDADRPPSSARPDAPAAPDRPGQDDPGQGDPGQGDPGQGDPGQGDPRQGDPNATDGRAPDAECDVVLQGGTASGVIYPRALATLAGHYRLRGIGGTSAGAMAAAVAAASEYGRSTGRGGFGGFDEIPTELSGGRLQALFQPRPRTRPLFRLLLAATGGDRADGRTLPSRIAGVLAAALTGYPAIAALGVLPGLLVLIIGILLGDGWAVALGVLLLIIVELAALAAAVLRAFVRDLPENAFGICTGRTEQQQPALIEWLSSKINSAAGLPVGAPPLTFGQLWTAGSDRSPAAAGADERLRLIDLRMMTTCLSEARPYELPFAAGRFFYDRNEWAEIFPPEVIAALDAAPEPRVPSHLDVDSWHADRDQATRHPGRLRRLPDPEHLPVVVAARLSLSMPVMISAVPLWVIERREVTDQPDPRLDPAGPRHFVKVWFCDGGLSANFPVHLFDATLPTRPTFAINLQMFPPGTEPADDQADNVEWAHDNADGLAPRIARWPDRGPAALAGYLAAIYTSSSSWQDSTQLTFPGFRDRIVRVLQSPREGGINLAMDDRTIDRLARRGEHAAEAIIGQFEQPHYPPVVAGRPTRTGWQNHRWVRYRALLSVLPQWAESYGRGRTLIDPELVADPPGYRFGSAAERDLADGLDAAMSELARVVDTADPQALAALRARPRPVGDLRRRPEI